MGDKSIFRQNERWIVTVRRKDCPDVIMDEYYLYLLDFIYGDEKQQKKEMLTKPRKKQFVGNRQTVEYNKESIGCKIVLPSDKLRDNGAVLGEIRFEQDFGLIIDDYGYNGKNNEYTFLKITDGLNITICEFELTFKKDSFGCDVASECGGYITVGKEKPEEPESKSAGAEEKPVETDDTPGESTEAKEDKKPDYNDTLKSGVRKILELVIEWLRKLSEKLGGK